jgi:hypothetical protein
MYDAPQSSKAQTLFNNIHYMSKFASIIPLRFNRRNNLQGIPFQYNVAKTHLST